MREFVPAGPPGRANPVLALLVLLAGVAGAVASSLVLLAAVGERLPMPWRAVAAAVVGALVPTWLAWRAARALRRANGRPNAIHVLALLVLGAVHGGILLSTTRALNLGLREVARATRSALEGVPGVPPAVTALLDDAARTGRVEVPGLAFFGTGDPPPAGGGELPPPVIEPAPPRPPAPDGGPRLELFPPRPRPAAPAQVDHSCPRGARAQDGPSLAERRRADPATPPADVGRWRHCVDKEGRLHGASVQWDARGNVREVGQFKAGHKDGVFLRFGADGRLREKGAFLDDERTGPWEEWSDRTAQTDDMHETELWTGHYVMGKRDGKWEGFTERCRGTGARCLHQRVEVAWRAGRQHGVFARYYEDGSRASQGRYEDGRRDGTWVGWYAGGQAAWAQSWKGGERTGKWRRFCPDARLIELVTYDEQGRRHGPYAAFYPSGQKRFAGGYVEGLRDGEWTEYGEGGGSLGWVRYSGGAVKESHGEIQLKPPRCAGGDPELARHLHAPHGDGAPAH